MKKKIVATILLAASLVILPLWGQQSKAAAMKTDEKEQYVEAASTVVVPADGYNPAFEVDWGAVQRELAEAALSEEERNIDVLMGSAAVVPREVLAVIAGKKVTMALQTGNGLAFSLSGQDVSSVDAKVELALSSHGIPETVKQKILSGACGSFEFNLGDGQELPLHMNVHMNFGQENAGKVTALYRYDVEKGMLKFLGTSRTNLAGQVMFGLDRKDTYLAVVVDRPAVDIVQPGDTLSHIALRNGTTVSALRRANPQIVDIDMIRPGQEINLY